ncbi:MAG: tRNA (cytidine(34)-2'-O)-methyltransferase [Amphiplicatus sp.]
MRLALFEPDIPQNVGAAIRAAACFGAGVDIIGPAGFPLDSRQLRRVAMDYAALASPRLHESWRHFAESPARRAARLVLLTTKAADSLWDFAFTPDDILLLGRESAGAPGALHEAADARLAIPLAPGARSLNVATAAAIALAEARRQIGWRA